jgi:hypothetical protein
MQAHSQLLTLYGNVWFGWIVGHVAGCQEAQDCNHHRHHTLKPFTHSKVCRTSATVPPSTETQRIEGHADHYHILFVVRGDDIIIAPPLTLASSLYLPADSSGRRFLNAAECGLAALSQHLAAHDRPYLVEGEAVRRRDDRQGVAVMPSAVPRARV